MTSSTLTTLFTLIPTYAISWRHRDRCVRPAGADKSFHEPCLKAGAAFCCPASAGTKSLEVRRHRLRCLPIFWRQVGCEHS